jgi:hypothetical protein
MDYGGYLFRGSVTARVFLNCALTDDHKFGWLIAQRAIQCIYRKDLITGLTSMLNQSRQSTLKLLDEVVLFEKRSKKNDVHKERK